MLLCQPILRATTYCFLAFAATAICQDKPPGQSAVISIFACDEKGKTISHATGFFISSDGVLASTRHAVEHSPNAVIQMNDGRILGIMGVVAEDPLHDLVLLKVHGSGFPYLKLSAFDHVRKDAPVTMIVDTYVVREAKGSRSSAPSEPDGRFLTGTINSVDNLADDYQWFSIRMPIRRGESGSPVFDEAGGVIGMVRAQIGNSDNTAFVVSADYITHLLLTSAGLIPKPVAQLEKRQYDEIFDDLDFKAGLQAANNGEYREARRRLELAVKRFPESGAFHVLLGSCYARLSMQAEATAELKRTVAINPGNAMAWASMGMAFITQGKPDEAAVACKTAVALKSTLPDTWFNVAGVYMALSRYNEARVMLKRLQDFKTTAADEMAGKLAHALEIVTAQSSGVK